MACMGLKLWLLKDLVSHVGLSLWTKGNIDPYGSLNVGFRGARVLNTSLALVFMGPSVLYGSQSLVLRSLCLACFRHSLERKVGSVVGSDGDRGVSPVGIQFRE